MKRNFALILATLLILSATACGNSASGNSGQSVSAAVSKEESKTENSNIAVSPGTVKKKAQIKETVLLDTDNVKVTATGLIYNEYGVGVELLLENNTDTDLSFACGSFEYNCNSVNGYMIPDGGYLYCDVSAGKKARDTAAFTYDKLTLLGITEIADIELGFYIHDTNYNSIYTGSHQMKTSIADSFDYDALHYQIAMETLAFQNALSCSVDYFSAEELHNQDGIGILSEALFTNRDGKTMLLLEMMNASPNMVYVVTSDISINGLVCNSLPWSYDAVVPGKKHIVRIDLSSISQEAYWKSFDIENITHVDVTLNIEDEDGYTIANPAVLSVKISEPIPLNSSGTEVYNANGIRIVSKGIFESASSYNDDLFIVFLVENNSGKRIRVSDVYDSASVNGFMTDYSLYAVDLDNGENAVMEVELWDTALEKNKIAGISGVTEFEIKLSLESGYNKLDEPKIVVTY